MAKIVIASVNNDEATYTVLIALTEPHLIEGESQDIPIGEATITFPHKTPMDDIKKEVIKAAQGIFKSHENALDKKSDLEEVAWPEIT